MITYIPCLLFRDIHNLDFIYKFILYIYGILYLESTKNPNRLYDHHLMRHEMRDGNFSKITVKKDRNIPKTYIPSYHGRVSAR